MENVKSGYEYLLAYKLTVPVYDYTVIFCDRNINKFSRTHDQMVQAARSGMQNISEGSKQQGMKGYIKLSGVARGSLEELLKDYCAFLRQKGLQIWNKERANYLIDKLIMSLKEKHMKTGGLTEELYNKRKSYRGY